MGSARVLTLFAVGVVSLAIFVLLELRQQNPMLDMRLFRNPTFSGANTVMFFVGLAVFGIFFYNSLFLQRVLGYGAIETGATFLPLTGLIILVAPVAGKLSDALRPALADGRRDDAPRRVALALRDPRCRVLLVGHRPGARRSPDSGWRSRWRRRPRRRCPRFPSTRPESARR
jgi:hypothetical protein